VRAHGEVRLDLHILPPRFAIVDSARDNDNARAREVCAAIGTGEIVLFDRAYVDFAHLFGLLMRGVNRNFQNRLTKTYPIRCPTMGIHLTQTLTYS